MATKFCFFPPLIILTILTFSSSGNAQVSEVTTSNQGVLYASPPPPNGCPYSCLPPPTPTDCPPPPSSPQLPPSGPVNYPPPMGYYLPPGGDFLPPPMYVYGPPPPNPILPYLPFYYKNPPSDYSSAASDHNLTSKLLFLFTLLLIWSQ
ncbi:extensin-like [Solanum stenotomum]|uniref:extensin-like n=1 Tax=Solanum stenotomum TaxID=172797 RepID=UPI0020D0E673|nr:extensin-like [Solanum stenotomum]